jgi:hypothetical protein
MRPTPAGLELIEVRTVDPASVLLDEGTGDGR